MVYCLHVFCPTNSFLLFSPSISSAHTKNTVYILLLRATRMHHKQYSERTRFLVVNKLRFLHSIMYVVNSKRWRRYHIIFCIHVIIFDTKIHSFSSRVNSYENLNMLWWFSLWSLIFLTCFFVVLHLCVPVYVHPNTISLIVEHIEVKQSRIPKERNVK